METGESLLLTKLFMPRMRPSRVARLGLVARLNQALNGKLTLVSAPAGFGKTTLVADWLQQMDRLSSWLSLDDGDNDPHRFLAYVTAALQRINGAWGQTVQELLRSPQPPNLRAMAAALINEIGATDSPFVLVLDDYHLISALSVHDALAFLVDNLPPQIHLVVLSRADPPVALARLRAHGEVAEIRADDLRFTPEEAAAFLNEVMNLGLTQQQIAVLESRTEGWVAGLQLASLSLQSLPHDEVAGFIKAFAGSHRYVMDYLIEEVFSRQPVDAQQFLLQTSILDRLCGSLCDAITGRHDGQAILEWLDAVNLFIVPLDHERRWYRYHQLFVDLLRDRLRQAHAECLPELYCRAAVWCESDGMIEDAVRYALQANDYGLATRLIEQALCKFFPRNEHLTIMRWMRALPRELVLSRPRLCLGYAVSLTASGDLEAAAAHIEIARSWLQESPLFEYELSSAASCPYQAEPKCAGQCYATMQGASAYVDILRALIACYQSPSTAIEIGQRASAQIPPQYSRLRGLALLILGQAYFLDGNSDAADSTLSKALEMNRASGHAAASLGSSYHLACLRILQGRLREARTIYEDAIRFVGEQRQPVFGGIEHVGMGDLLREWNDLESASNYIGEGLRLIETSGDFEFLRDGYLARARLDQARGSLDSALAFAQRAAQTVRRSQPAWDTALVEAWRARFWLAQGNLLPAELWAQTCALSVEDSLDFLREFGHLTLARLLLAQGKPAVADAFIERLLEAAELAGRTGRVIETLVLRSLARQACGDTPGALAALERSLTLAEPERYIRTFLDEGAPMAALLRHALAQGIGGSYVSRLLAAFQEPVAGSPLVEPLTQRELEVLRLIVDGLKNQEIADRLVISVATVKRHVTNIYGKLGVSRRVQAVAQAQELNLL
jgi:LuxR family maltose regulon positive regulatory protein